MMPAELQSAVRDGHAALAADTHAVLPLVQRRKLWRSLGPVAMDGEDVLAGDGLRRRVALAELTVRRVLSVWERAFPGDDRAASLLETARQYLSGEINADAARAASDHFWSRLDGLIARGVDPAAVYVGYAAAKVRSLALNDQYGIVPEDEEEASSATQRDEDLDPYMWDASFYASSAAAGGMPWEDGSSRERRNAFWRWYLDEAVPAAWDAVVAAPAV